VIQSLHLVFTVAAIFDWAPQHFYPTNPHIAGCAQVTLEIIARGRHEGVLQSELPKMLNKQPTNFNYTLRKLLALGLVIKTPVKVRSSSSAQVTALLHHVCFPPSLAPGPIRVRSPVLGQTLFI
jgi:hypothetical protein